MPSFITPSDITLAYRKAKADAFFENGHLNLYNFAIFERGLEENLANTLQRLLNWDDTEPSREFVGTAQYILKECVEKPRDGFVFFSDIKRDWEQTITVDVDFRLIGHHPVQFHILSSLWLEKVGLKLDALISAHSYGCRLKPIDENELNFYKQRDTRLPGHFRPYFHDYQSWQHNGIDAIQKAITDDRKVIAVTADIKKFYHRIDPTFLLSEEFAEYFGIRLSLDEQRLTRMLCEALKLWGNQVEDEDTYNGLAGIPIGLGASKVIANVLLGYLDQQISRELLPIYYGRYVDDIFLVIEDNGQINNSRDFWAFLSKRIPGLILRENDDQGPVLNIPYGRRSYIEFGKGKEKLFMLEGSSGSSFIDSLKNTLEENSSEWKLLPDTEENLNDFAKEMAQPTYDLQDAANGLRKADGVSIQRLKFALQLRNFESIIELLPKKLWIDGLKTFFSIAKDFVLSPAKIGTFSRYFPRLIRIAVRADEPQLAQEIWLEIERAWYNLILKLPRDKQHLAVRARAYNKELVSEAISSSAHPLKNYRKKDWKIIFDAVNLDASLVKETSALLFLSDLHAIPYKKIFFDYALKQRFWFSEDVDESSFLDLEVENRFYKTLELSRFYEFVQAADQHEWNWRGRPLVPIGLALYTRPLSSLELTLLFPDWSATPNDFKTLQKMRRVFNMPPSESSIEQIFKGANIGAPEPPLVAINVPDHQSGINRTFALTSFETSESSWIAWVRDDGFEPDHQRYTRLFRLINDIIRLNHPSIQYLVLPELSVPRDILLFIAGKLKSKRISLIAGAEYRKYTAGGFSPDVKGIVSNQLVYILTAKSGTLTEQVAIIQEKTIPAIHEERELYDVGGKILVASHPVKYLVNHAGFTFSGLICNDILNIDNRYRLRGLIDALIVIEWNKDIDTYDSMVTSACSDLHTFVIQVNNRLYGDTRLRAPYKESYRRDMVRVRGGLLDYFVVSTIDVESLREFQRNHRSPDKPFKPVPTGFEMSTERRKKK